MSEILRLKLATWIFNYTLFIPKLSWEISGHLVWTQLYFQLIEIRFGVCFSFYIIYRSPINHTCFIMMQVAKSDWIKFNEFAEGAMIARNISKASDIKHQRKVLLAR